MSLQIRYMPNTRTRLPQPPFSQGLGSRGVPVWPRDLPLTKGAGLVTMLDYHSALVPPEFPRGPWGGSGGPFTAGGGELWDVTTAGRAFSSSDDGGQDVLVPPARGAQKKRDPSLSRRGCEGASPPGLPLLGRGGCTSGHLQASQGLPGRPLQAQLVLV